MNSFIMIFDFNNNKIVKVKYIDISSNIDKKVKNLSKVKSYLKLVKFKKPTKVKINEAFLTSFFPINARLIFIQLH